MKPNPKEIYDASIAQGCLMAWARSEVWLDQIAITAFVDMRYQNHVICEVCLAVIDIAELTCGIANDQTEATGLDAGRDSAGPVRRLDGLH